MKKIGIEICSTHNEGKSVVAERFIRTLKTKHTAALSKNVYIDQLSDIVNEYNNTYHRMIKIKSANVKDNAYIEFPKEFYDKHPKFKVGERVRISKYKKSFANGYTPNWSEEVSVIKEIKNVVPWTYVIGDINDEKLLEHFMKKKLQKTNQKKFRMEKVIKKKGDKLYVK